MSFVSVSTHWVKKSGCPTCSVTARVTITPSTLLLNTALAEYMPGPIPFTAEVKVNITLLEPPAGSVPEAGVAASHGADEKVLVQPIGTAPLLTSV